MLVSVSEAKEYLRVDADYEDLLIEKMVKAAEKICSDVARLEVSEFEEAGEVAKMAVLYALGYLYENRAGGDYQQLTLTLRAILFAIREGK